MAIASAAAAVVGAGVSLYQANESRKQTKRANEQIDEQNRLNAAAEKKLKDRKLNEEALLSSKAYRTRAGQSAGGDRPYFAKGGTVATGPLGISTAPSTGLRTILGG